MRLHLTYSLLVATFLGLMTSSAMEVERFDKLGTKDGLSQSSVVSSFCDSRGFLWFGTMDGLNRYDGYNFHVYRKHLNNPYSISNNRILRIWEDANQFIWTESHDGHYHYLDLTSDRFYTFPESDIISENVNVQITSFLETNDQEIWLGTDHSGVYHLMLNQEGTYNSRYFSAEDLQLFPEESINFFVFDRNSNIHVGTTNGVIHIRKSNKEDSEYSINRFMPDFSFSSAVKLNGKIWFGTKSGLVSYDPRAEAYKAEELIPKSIPVTSLHRSNSGSLIIGTQNNGLIVVNTDLNQKFHYFADQSIERIHEDKSGVLWVLSDKRGISRLNVNNSIEQHYKLVPEENHPLYPNKRRVFFEDNQGNIWIGSRGGGLALYDAEKSELTFFRNNPENPYSLGSDVVNCITQDKSGLIWVGTGLPNGGVHKVIPANPMFRHLAMKEKLNSASDNIVRGIFEDSNQNVWVATKSGHINIYNQDFELIYQFDQIQSASVNVPESNVYSILQDNDGYIWIGAKWGGVAVSREPLNSYSHYDQISFNTYRHKPEDPASLSSDLVYSIFQDKQGTLWIGTFGGGLNKVLNRTNTHLFCERINSSNSNLSSDEIRMIYQDHKSRIWLATTYGINLLNHNPVENTTSFVTFTPDMNNPKSLSYNDVVHIYEDSHQVLWFGTFGGGLNYFRDQNNPEAGFYHVTSNDGLINDVVFGISGDSFGNLWLSTQNGISRFDPEKNQFDNFDTNNGLIDSEFSENSCTKLSSGNLAFGTTSGLLIITPGEISSNSYAPPVCFTNFLLFNQEVKPGEEDSPLHTSIDNTKQIVLKHNQSSFSFEYAALSYFDPKKNQYSYMLENFDDRWYNVKNQRKATYTNIPPGEYIFKVKGANWDGTWNNRPREIRIKILRPWWNTFPAYVGLFLVLLLITGFLRRVYSNYHRLQTDLMVEKRVNEIKLQFFTNISHEIRTPLTLIMGPLEDLKKSATLPGAVRESVNLMNKNGKRILRLVNQLLDFRKIQNKKMKLMVQEVNLSHFVNEVCSNFNQLALHKNIQFTFPEATDKETVWFDAEKIDSVLFNLLSNAFKFTPNGKSIDVSIESTEEHHFITVKDEGKGMTRDEIPLIFERFNTLSSNNIDFSGTGIGLAYSKELMGMHSGEIKVESTPGKGSTFTMILPTGYSHYSEEIAIFASDHQQEKLPHKHFVEMDSEVGQELESSPEQLNSRKIVIVEDNHEVSQYLESILGSWFETHYARNGVEGLQKINEIHPDLVITDVMMPEMDGLELTRRIKEDFTISHIPVVMLTARSNMDDQIQGIETGAEAYVLKPFNSSHLISILKNLLKQRDILSRKLQMESQISDLKITNRDEEFINQTVASIEKNCMNANFNVNELVRQSNLSRTVFFNKLKGLTGLSPVEFIRKIKLQIASRYLKESNYGVAESAYLSGFNDVKYFTRRFKKEFGMNPSEYRKQHNPGFKTWHN